MDDLGLERETYRSIHLPFIGHFYRQLVWFLVGGGLLSQLVCFCLGRPFEPALLVSCFGRPFEPALFVSCGGRPSEPALLVSCLGRPVGPARCVLFGAALWASSFGLTYYAAFYRPSRRWAGGALSGFLKNKNKIEQICFLPYISFRTWGFGRL